MEEGNDLNNFCICIQRSSMVEYLRDSRAQMGSNPGSATYLWSWTSYYFTSLHFKISPLKK